MATDRVDVVALADEISAPQFWHWVAMNQLDPWTAGRGDMQAAIVAATVANAASRQRFRPSDFMPDFGETDGMIRDPDALKALFMSLAK